MHVKELTLCEVKEIYDTYMQEAFPPSELRPYKNIKMLTEAGNYVSYGLYDEALLAYALFAKTNNGRCCLLDYYAVAEGMRGKGIGSRYFSMLKEIMQKMRTVFIEVESPASADSEEELALRQRRIRFYESNGCVMTDVRCILYGVDFSIMVLPLDDALPDNETVLCELERIYHTMFDEELYKQVCHPFINSAV